MFWKRPDIESAEVLHATFKLWKDREKTCVSFSSKFESIGDVGKFLQAFKKVRNNYIT